ncbi:hypothetical protein E2C01_018026 [Portunus trituberculatus]|uniref:Uncharacterized protein n=1 Tax=Portunus trituberculatus TaxID=210409 RepID=A0A5B7DTG1_PORTR|nr:hypothetical protein [Portunus trituberculatus]
MNKAACVLHVASFPHRIPCWRDRRFRPRNGQLRLWRDTSRPGRVSARVGCVTEAQQVSRCNTEPSPRLPPAHPQSRSLARHTSGTGPPHRREGHRCVCIREEDGRGRKHG